MQSIFRYPGGKSRKAVREWIAAHRPAGMREYREPFVGGGGIFFHLPDPGERWINDRHSGLIAVYNALAERPAEFIAACREIEPVGDDEELNEPGPRGTARHPKRLVDAFDRMKLNTDCDQALRYLFINKTVFGGRVNYDIPSRLYFSNPSGWNVVKGDVLEQAAKHIAGTRITCGDYRPLLSEPGENVWVYADPPYAVNTALSPTSQLYQHGFTEQDHRDFAEAVKASPHNVCISYDDDADGFIRSLFDGFTIIEGSWKYAGSTQEKKSDGRELLILNYDPPTTTVSVPESYQDDDELDEEELELLEECERAVGIGKRSFILMGEALRTIRDSGKPSRRLYRATHATFEDYCIDRWGFSKSRANQLIEAESIAARLEMTTMVAVLPDAERQARELTRCNAPEQQAAVWQAVTEDAAENDRKITAALVRQHVDAAIGYEREPPDLYKTLLSTWKRADEEARRNFYEAVREELPA